MLILARNYDEKAVFIPYKNLSAIETKKEGETYTVLFFTKNGLIYRNQGFETHEDAVNSVKNMGIDWVENK